jgi:hypothetical protein
VRGHGSAVCGETSLVFGILLCMDSFKYYSTFHGSQEEVPRNAHPLLHRPWQLISLSVANVARASRSRPLTKPGAWSNMIRNRCPMTGTHGQDARATGGGTPALRPGNHLDYSETSGSMMSFRSSADSPR